MLAAFAPHAGEEATGVFGAGLFSLAIGVGLLRGYRCAWGFAVMNHFLSIVESLMQFNPITLVVSGLILVYLCSTQVRSAFETPSLSVQQTVQLQEDLNRKMVS